MNRVKIISDVYIKTQSEKYLIGIWWYQIRTGILEYSTKAKGHLDKKYFKLSKLALKDKSIIRGRFIKEMDTTYLVIFSENLGVISEAALLDLRKKVELKSNVNVDFVVDYDGYLLSEHRTSLEKRLGEI